VQSFDQAPGQITVLGAGHEMNDDLGIHIRLKNGSFGFEFAFNERGIGQITVVGNGQTSLVIIHRKGLRIFELA